MQCFPDMMTSFTDPVDKPGLGLPPREEPGALAARAVICAGARRNPCPSPAHAQNEVRAPERCCARSIAFGTACISTNLLASSKSLSERHVREFDAKGELYGSLGACSRESQTILQID
jgi:hypothetical protein